MSLFPKKVEYPFKPVEKEELLYVWYIKRKELIVGQLGIY